MCKQRVGFTWLYFEAVRLYGMCIVSQLEFQKMYTARGTKQWEYQALL